MAKKYFGGFTLVELMIVLAIIAILATLAIVSFQNQIFKGNDAKRKGDLDRIKIAAEEYEKDHNCYPDSIICGVHANQEIYPYLSNVPCDPVTNASYLYTADSSSVCPAWFGIYSVLQNNKDLSASPGIGPMSSFNYMVASDNYLTSPITVPTSGATPTSGPTSTPSPTSTPPPQNNFYGCKNLVCTQISWDNSRPGPECDPNYQNSNCYGQCSNPAYECTSWH